jgi:hypothetical protein
MLAWFRFEKKSNIAGKAEFLNSDTKLNHTFQTILMFKFFIFSQYLNMDLVKFSCDISYMKIHVATPLFLRTNNLFPNRNSEFSLNDSI